MTFFHNNSPTKKKFWIRSYNDLLLRPWKNIGWINNRIENSQLVSLKPNYFQFHNDKTQHITLLSRWLSTEVLNKMVVRRAFCGNSSHYQNYGTFFIDLFINIKKWNPTNGYQQRTFERARWFETTLWQRSSCATFDMTLVIRM